MSKVSPPHKIHALDAPPNGLTLAEQALHLLRRNGRQALAEYYIGTLPFLLGLLFFWSDMSRNPFARWYCGPAAAGLALLFIWMKLWQVRFGRRLRNVIDASPQPTWSWGQMVVVAARQSGLQATGWIALPIASVVVLPIGWVYAFYQNLTVMDGPDQSDTRSLVGRASRQAALSPGQNHVLLSVSTLFGLVVLANVAICLILVPQLLQKLLGIETVFALSGFHLLNTTFIAVVCALTYLLVDPLIKAAYALRCHFGRSRRNGDDIRIDLKYHAAVGVIAFALILGVGSSRSAAEPPPAASPSPSSVTQETALDPHDLDQAIDQVLQQRHFAWRLGRDKIDDKPKTKTWLEKAAKWMIDGLASMVNAIADWLQRLWDWLVEKLPKSKHNSSDTTRQWRNGVKIAFYLFGGMVLALLLWKLLRRMKSHWKRRASDDRPVDVQPVDLADETISAQDLPVDQWLTLAMEMLSQQDHRRALRALYLAILAILADHGRLVIARYKSNQEYYTELVRRGRSEPELLKLFDRCRRMYERVWYGMHAVSAEQIGQFKSQQERIAALVQSAA